MFKRVLQFFAICLFIVSCIMMGFGKRIDKNDKASELREAIDLTKQGSFTFNYQNQFDLQPRLMVWVDLPEVTRDPKLMSIEKYQKQKEDIIYYEERLKEAKTLDERTNMQRALRNKKKYLSKIEKEKQVIDTTEIDRQLKSRYREIYQQFKDHLLLEITLDIPDQSEVICKHGDKSPRLKPELFNPSRENQRIQLIYDCGSQSMGPFENATIELKVVRPISLDSAKKAHFVVRILSKGVDVMGSLVLVLGSVGMIVSIAGFVFVSLYKPAKEASRN